MTRPPVEVAFEATPDGCRFQLDGARTEAVFYLVELKQDHVNHDR